MSGLLPLTPYIYTHAYHRYQRLVQEIRDQLHNKQRSYPTSLHHDEEVLAQWPALALHIHGTEDGEGGTEEHRREHNLLALQYRVYAKRHLLALRSLYGASASSSKIDDGTSKVSASEQDIAAAAAVCVGEEIA